MSHYAKLAALVFRVAAVLVLCYSLFALLVLARMAGDQAGGTFATTGIIGLLCGLVLFAAAGPLGRLSAAGLHNSERSV